MTERVANEDQSGRVPVIALSLKNLLEQKQSDSYVVTEIVSTYNFSSFPRVGQEGKLPEILLLNNDLLSQSYLLRSLHNKSTRISGRILHDRDLREIPSRESSRDLVAVHVPAIHLIRTKQLSEKLRT
jgi:hypothetical protein